MKTVHFTSALILTFFPLIIMAQAEPVAMIKGQQLTGVTVSDSGRVFTNFPQWREGVENAVIEIDTSGNDHQPYPNKNWNRWKPGDTITNDLFVAVQSVVAFKEYLYVLDTRNPFFQGVQGAPTIFVFNLNTDSLVRAYELSENSFHADSYINDLRIDPKRNKAWFTDSGHPGLVILDLDSGVSTRILDAHPSTTAETDQLTIDGKAWSNTVHSDGIALDSNKDLLYYHALTGYTLYALPLDQLNEGSTPPEALVISLGKTPAPDGMITDRKGNLYMADLEGHKIVYRTPEGNMQTLIEGPNVKWADTFSIYNGYLYYTNSKIHMAGPDVSNMEFEIYKVPLP
ncbi:L-dopachrome tautomerase-related protein [Robertkochia sediminum]|uniref:L-dopachrome tautomerase-related protein n=1 Tax=Robertkochia sediminum TaxID=2785326 RepID=UPI00193254E7|nr:L-dopachrome tautomerase-related protein [Robertkochia sediminum]MBL7474080.1 SMP-30/gluconolactonase/LRE family protein [Robertkochia sediminum]